MDSTPLRPLTDQQAEAESPPPPVSAAVKEAEGKGGKPDQAVPSGPDAAAERAQRLVSRVLDDDALRVNLTDDEAAPLLQWASRRAEALMRASAAIPDDVAEELLETLAGQIRELIRLVDLALGDRGQISAELFAARLEALDTLVGLPLFNMPQAQIARARLEVLLEEPPERLAQRQGAELTRALCDAFG